MNTWAFVAQKGGGGKSSFALTLACIAEQEGEVALIIDMDRQGSALYWHRVRGNDAPLVIGATIEQLVPTLKQAAAEGVTLALIDTAGHEDAMSLAAIRAADLIVVPVRPNLLDVASIADTADLLHDAGKLGSALAVLNQVVPTRDGQRDADDVELALKDFGLRVASARISMNNDVPSAIAAGQGVSERATGRAKPASATEFLSLWRELKAGVPKGRRTRKGTPQ